LAACAGVLVLALCGCGSSDNGVASKSANEIFAASLAAAKGASSVHVVAKGTSRRASFTLDAVLAEDRAHARLAFAGGSIDVIRIANAIYIKGDKNYNARLGADFGVNVPNGVWLKGAVTSRPLGQIGAFTAMGRELALILGASGPLAKGPKTKLVGKPAIELKQTGKLYSGALYIATTGKPYPLLLHKSGSEVGVTTFTGWDHPVAVKAPASATEFARLERTATR
jgi:hypothetical protein